MRKIPGMLVGALFSLAAAGQDLLQCVNPDVINGLLFSGRPESRIEMTAALPESLDGFEAPAGFALIGTAVRGGGQSTSVAYRTSLEGPAAYGSMLDAFVSNGWVLEEEPVPFKPIFFVDAISANVSGTVCRDTERRNLRVQYAGDHRYMMISLNDQPQTRGCNVEDPRRMIVPRMMGGLSDQVPTLRLSAGTTAADGSGNIGSGSSGSGDSMITSSQIRTPAAPVDFMVDLDEQMSAQGWRADARWSGSVSHGGRWIKTNNDGLVFWSTVELVDIGNGLYDLSYRGMTSPF